MNKNVVSVVLALSLAASVASCSAPAATDTTPEETPAAVAPIYPIIYEDACGNEITIEAAPDTVICMSPSVTEIVYALDAEEKLVGRADCCDYPGDVLSIESVGTDDNPDVDAIASLEPDIVIASTLFSADAYGELVEQGITVVFIDDATSIGGMFNTIKDVADIIGVHEDGEALVEELQTELDELWISAPNTEISVYYCRAYGEYGDYTAGNNTLVGNIITASGAINAASDVSGWIYSADELMEADPDYILIDEPNYDGFVSTEPYASLTAVREGRVIVVDPALVGRSGPRNVDAVELIQNAITED